MRDVYFYTDVDSLSQLGGSVHITSSIDMADCLLSNSIQAVPVRNLFFRLIGFWRSKEVRMSQYVMVSNILRSICTASDRRWYHGCRKNAYGIMYSIRELEEAGAVPDDVVVKDRSSELLKNVWKRLESENSSFCYLRRRFKELEDPVLFASCLPEAFGGMIPENVVFNGFYRMSPLHERLMGLFEKHGCRVSIAGIADNSHTFINEVWERVLSRSDYSEPSEWMYLGKTISNIFTDKVEFGKTDRPSNLRVIRHTSVFDLVKDVGRCMKEGRKVFTPDTRYANRILRETYPGNSGRRLDRTSIGRFVIALHHMWSEEDDRILIGREDLISCFSSGWLQVNGINGKDHLRSLEAVLPYFERCRTSSDWVDRVRSLADVYRGPLKEMGLNDPGKDRWERVFGNPLLSFSMFSLSEKEFSEIRTLLMRAATLAEELFLNGKYTIKEHLEILKGFFTECPEGLEDELGMFMNAMDKVISNQISDTECTPADMADTVPRLIRDEFDEASEDPRGVALPLFRAEPLVLNGGGPVHICVCDSRSMPGGEDSGRWPLTIELLRSMVDSNPSLSRLLIYRTTNSSTNRYLMGLIMQNPDVEISWVEETAGGKNGCSPYVSLLSDNICEMVEDIRVDDYISVASNTDVKPDSKAFHPVEFTLDDNLCSYRYVYGYVLRSSPSFDNVFMQGYAAAALVETLTHTTDQDPEKVKEDVMGMFSNLLSVHRRQMVDTVGRGDGSGMFLSMKTDYHGREYPNERVRVSFASPGNEVLRHAIAKDRRTISELNLICRYCPSRRLCKYRRV